MLDVAYQQRAHPVFAAGADGKRLSLVWTTASKVMARGTTAFSADARDFRSRRAGGYLLGRDKPVLPVRFQVNEPIVEQPAK